MNTKASEGWTAMDDYGSQHCEKTAEYVTMFARALGLAPAQQRALRLAGLLHRVGRFGVPEDIARKPGPLSDDEFEVVKHQLGMAAHLIVDVPHSEEVRKAIQYHHERWDGGGYPEGLGGKAIPYLARVLAIADAFSAITLERTYRRALPLEEARDELSRVSGAQLDPDLVPAFVEIVGRSRGGVQQIARPVSRGLRPASYAR